MLKTIIHQKNVHTNLLQPKSLFVAIFANSKLYTGLEPHFHLLDFVAGTLPALISPSENTHAIPLRQKPLRQPDDHWRFTGTANRQISNANHRRANAALRQNPFRVHPHADANNFSVNPR